MQCSLCYNKPKLINTTEPFKKKSGNYCSCCGVDIIAKGRYFMCDKCKKYNLCDNCKVCPSGHFLGKVISLNKMGASLY